MGEPVEGVKMLTDELLTVNEVSKKLKVCGETVRRWISEGKIRGMRIGGKRAGYRIPASEIERFLKAS